MPKAFTSHPMTKSFSLTSDEWAAEIEKHHPGLIGPDGKYTLGDKGEASWTLDEILKDKGVTEDDVKTVDEVLNSHHGHLIGSWYFLAFIISTLIGLLIISIFKGV